MLPDIFAKAYRQGLLLAVIQFGSSLYSSGAQDIDIAVITSQGNFDNFLKLVAEDKSARRYDISLIKSEEIGSYKKFYFGSHGQHLIESLRNGLALIGQNPFVGYPLTKAEDVKSSVFERMKEYIYVLRKGYFDESYEHKFLSRYDKIIKLSALLLIDEYAFPDVLEKDVKSIQDDLIKKGYTFTEDKKRNIENLWTKINELYS